MIKTLRKKTSPQSNCSEGHGGALRLAHETHTNYQSVDLQSLQKQKVSDQESEPEETCLYFRHVVLRPVASALAESLLKMQNFRPHSGPTESGTLG